MEALAVRFCDSKGGFLIQALTVKKFKAFILQDTAIILLQDYASKYIKQELQSLKKVAYTYAGRNNKKSMKLKAMEGS